jgi:hypothetical protein
MKIFMVVTPCEQRLIPRGLHDLFLESEECLVSLAVKQRHTDIEDSKQAIGKILGSGSLPARYPGHPFGNTSLRERLNSDEMLFVNGRDGRDILAQFKFSPDFSTTAREKYEVFGCQKFLKCPSSREPSAAMKT